MQPQSWEVAQHRQTLFQQRLEELRQRSLFLQEMFQSWQDFHQDPLADEERKTSFAYLQHEFPQFRQELQQLRQDLQHERKRWHEAE